MPELQALTHGQTPTAAPISLGEWQVCTESKYRRSQMSLATPKLAAKIFAVTLFVENVDDSKEFYTRVFDAPLVFEGATSAVFAFGETLVNLLQSSQAPELIAPAPVAAQDSGSRIQFTIQVDDVDATCETLKALGVTLLNGPMDRPWGIRTATFQDPSGHVWEIAK